MDHTQAEFYPDQTRTQANEASLQGSPSVASIFSSPDCGLTIDFPESPYPTIEIE